SATPTSTGSASRGSATGSATVATAGSASAGSASARSAAGSATGKTAGSAAPAPNVGSGKGSATGTPIPTEPMAVVVIESTPQDADVFDTAGKLVGKTPAKLELPISKQTLTFELRLAGFKKKQKQLVVSGNAVIDVPLERAPATVHGSP